MRGDPLSPRAIVVHGEPGVGKTSLLYEVQHRSKRWQRPCEFVHGGLIAHLDPAARDRLLFDAVSRGGVILVDGLEHLDNGRPELLETALAHLPAGTCIVAARRGRPPLRHSTTAVEVVELEPLSDLDQREYLWLRGLPEEHHDTIITLARGNPLLMALAADSAESWDGPPVANVVEQNLHDELLLRVCPIFMGRAKRAALDLASLAVAVTPDLLAAVLTELEHGDAPTTVYEWLQGLSFVERAPEGLQLCGIVREAWLARLRAERKPDLERTRNAARSYYQHRLRDGFRWSSTIAAIIFVDRDIDPFAALSAPVAPHRTCLVEVARSSDRDEILSVIEREEGAASHAAAEATFDQYSGSFSVCRGENQPVGGLLGTWTLPRDNELLARPAVRTDPALALVREFLAAHGGLAEGESALVFRWWMTRNGYQKISRPLGSVGTETGRLSQLARGLAFTFRFVADLESWIPLYEHFGFTWERLGSFTVGTHRLTGVVHHWRGRSLDELFEHRPGTPAPPPPQPVIVAADDPGVANGANGDELEALLAARLESAADSGGLTPREREVLRLLFLGRSISEIAVALHIRPRTAKFHQANVLTKLGADSRLDLFRVLL